jgi:hypothetical protein
MPLTLRKFVGIVVLVTSLVLSSSAVYSAYYYFGVYRAVRILDVTLESFDIEFVNATYGQMKIEIMLSNPSEFSFLIGQVTDVIYLNSGYFHTGTWPHPQSIESQSSVNMSHTIPIFESMVQSMTGMSSLEWLIELTLRFNGPMAGNFEREFELHPG